MMDNKQQQATQNQQGQQQDPSQQPPTSPTPSAFMFGQATMVPLSCQSLTRQAIIKRLRKRINYRYI